MQMRVTVFHLAHSAARWPFITYTCKAPAPVLSIFVYSDEGLHANENDLFLLAFFLSLQLYINSRGVASIAAVMAIRATGWVRDVVI